MCVFLVPFGCGKPDLENSSFSGQNTLKNEKNAKFTDFPNMEFIESEIHMV